MRCDVVHCVLNAHHLLRLFFGDFHLFGDGIIQWGTWEGGPKEQGILEGNDDNNGEGGYSLAWWGGGGVPMPCLPQSFDL